MSRCIYVWLLWLILVRMINMKHKILVKNHQIAKIPSKIFFILKLECDCMWEV